MKTKAQNSKNKKLNTNKGITLVALVITIIVLLILAGVAINMAINSNGLFGKANEAAEKWNTSVTNEKETLQGLLDKIGVYEKVVGDPAEWEVSGTTIVKYLGNKTEVVVPNYINGVAIDTLGSGNIIFDDNHKNITSITIPEGIKTIGATAFVNYSGITGNLILPNSLTTINAFVFNGCSGLTGNLVIPDNVTVIGNNAFTLCTGFTSLKLGKSVSSIGQTAFVECSGLTGDLIIPENVKTIGGSAFFGCTGLNSITIPDTVESVGYNAFKDVNQIYYNGPLDTSNWGARKVND